MTAVNPSMRLRLVCGCMTHSFPDDRESTRGLIDKLTPPGSPEEFLVAAAQDIAGVGIWKWDLRAERVMWSVGLQKLYGYEAGEFSGTVDAFLGHLLPEDRDRVWGHVQRSLQTLEPFAFEERIRRTDGKVRVLLSRGQPYFAAPGNLRGFMGVCHDVTEVGRAQEGLGTLEQRLRSIVDNTPSVITVKDLDGFYMMVNQECARLLALSPQDIVRHKCTEIFPPDLAATIAEADHIAASRNEHVYRDVEFQDRVYTSVTFPLPNGMGLPCATCTIATDISERSEREAERLARDATQRRIIMAIAENRLRCYAQPIMPLGDKPPKWELLARLREDGSDLAPPAWLPDAEQADIVVEVDVWMTAQAIKLAERGWHVNVNWSASTLCDERARRR